MGQAFYGKGYKSTETSRLYYKVWSGRGVAFLDVGTDTVLPAGDDTDCVYEYRPVEAQVVVS